MKDLRLAVVIMAAGKGTRMKDPDMAKVMYPINGKPMIEHVVNLADKLQASIIVVIVGWQKESVMAYLESLGSRAICVTQEPQHGTGHAVMQAEPPLHDFEGDVLILSGDVPLLSYTTARRLIDTHRASNADVTVLTAIPEDPTGYGRILRGSVGEVIGIVEHKDAAAEQRLIPEINSGIYVFDKVKLFEALKRINPDNLQKEYYLTDTLAFFWVKKWLVRGTVAPDSVEVQGINTLEQLEGARSLMDGR